MLEMSRPVEKLDGCMSVKKSEVSLHPEFFNISAPLKASPAAKSFRLDAGTIMYPKHELHLTVLGSKKGIYLKELKELVEESGSDSINVEARLKDAILDAVSEAPMIRAKKDLYRVKRTKEGITRETVVQAVDDQGLIERVRVAVLKAVEEIAAELSGDERREVEALHEKLAEEFSHSEPFPHVTLFTNEDGGYGISIRSKERFNVGISGTDPDYRIIPLGKG